MTNIARLKSVIQGNRKVYCICRKLLPNAAENLKTFDNFWLVIFGVRLVSVVPTKLLLAKLSEQS